jgi:hypothetical protein
MTPAPRYLNLVAMIGALFATGCGGATQATQVWTDPAFESNSLRKLMVIGVANTPTIRRSFEDRFVAALKAQGIDAEPSYRLVGDGNLDSARTSAEMRRTGCDGVFVTRIVDQTTARTYYPPTSSYAGAPYLGAPHAYRHGWYGYYGLGYAYASTPGYTVESQVVNLETTLYRVADGELVWSALSQEWLGQSDIPGSEVASLVRQLIRALVDSRVVVPRRP